MRIKVGHYYFREDFKNKEEVAKKYERVANHLLEDDRVEAIIVDYDTIYKKDTISIITKRCEAFRGDMHLELDLSNFEEVLRNVVALWETLPKEEYWKEQAEGIFNGRKIKFNRIFANYRFTDTEVEQLLNGETVTIKGGEFLGKLEEQEYHWFRYFGFKIIPQVPRKLQGVTLTDREIAKLYAGEELYVRNMYSPKKNTFYSAWVSFDKDKGIKFRFK